MSETLVASELASAPRGVIPTLDRPLSPAELEAALRAFQGSYYVEHPFHRDMYAGRLTPRQFQGWVANRLAYQRVVPRKDAAILSNCPDPAVRREWISRIIDHDGTREGEGGIELWIRLGVALGVPREEMEDERHVLPSVRLICRVVCLVLQVAAVGAGMRLVAHGALRAEDPCPAHRGISGALSVDPAGGPGLLQEPPGAGTEGRQHGLSIVQQHCTTVETQRMAFEALAFKLEMLWAMIDTIYQLTVTMRITATSSRALATGSRRVRRRAQAARAPLS